MEGEYQKGLSKEGLKQWYPGAFEMMEGGRAEAADSWSFLTRW